MSRTKRNFLCFLITFFFHSIAIGSSLVLRICSFFGLNLILSMCVFVSVSGFANSNIVKVLQGQRIGTLFHRDAKQWVQPGDTDARDMAVAARECSRRLQVLSN